MLPAFGRAVCSILHLQRGVAKRFNLATVLCPLLDARDALWRTGLETVERQRRAAGRCADSNLAAQLAPYRSRQLSQFSPASGTASGWQH